MNDLNEARRCLEASLGEELIKLYFTLLKQWFSFKESITKIQFNSAVRKLMHTEEQLHNHNTFMLALLARLNSSHVKSSSYKGSFELADYTDYVPPLSPTMAPPEYENRSAASELFLPDSGFIATRIAIHAWLNDLDGADDNVSEYLVTMCQLFVKNILTAMISKKKSYKIREQKFQYSFGSPIPDPFIRNTNNLMDPYNKIGTPDLIVQNYTNIINRDIKMETPDLIPQNNTNIANSNQIIKVETLDLIAQTTNNITKANHDLNNDENDENHYIPRYQPTLETMEQQTAFSYSCGKRSVSDGKLTLRLLYDTLKENPNIISFNSIHSIYLLKIGLQLEAS